MRCHTYDDKHQISNGFLSDAVSGISSTARRCRWIALLWVHAVGTSRHHGERPNDPRTRRASDSDDPMTRSPSATFRATRLLLPLLVAVAAFAWLRPDGSGASLQGHARHADCAVPIHAYVGDVDPRFGFDRHDVERALQDATGLWQQHTDRPLFDAAGAGRRPMPVDLVFDERQEQAAVMQQNRRSLERGERRLQERQAQFNRLQQQLESDGDALREGEQRLAERAAEHQRRVADWNAGRIERSDTAQRRLRAEADALRDERAQLESARQRLNETVAELNLMAVELNDELEAFNAVVESFNRAAGSPVTVGGYTWSSHDGRRITIYRAGDTDELVLLLAHELGHALGIGHVAERSAAVMSAEVSDLELPVTALEAADVAALQAVCGQ